jgi:glycosyltransferase involved in cell wall biosynthesis
VVSSSVVARRVLGTYGIEAEVIPPPPGLGPDGPETAVVDVEPGYFLCVSRLLPYKNVDAVIAAVSRIEGGRLVIVGNGPDHSRLSKYASSGVKFVGCIGDSELRWLYRHTRAVVAASYEDYGLTPLEAASFGRPSVVLREGGFLDTVVEGTTGVFFDRPQSDDIARALGALTSRSWDPDALLRHASSFSETRFVERIQEVISLEDRNAATAEHRGAMSEMALDGVAELS